MTSPRRSLIVGPAVVIEGPQAALLGGVLRDLLRRAYFDRMPAAARAEVLAMASALEHVGGRWRVEQAQRIAELGTAETHSAVQRGPSEPLDDPFISVGEASGLLALSSRRIRQLAASGMGIKRGSIWLLHRDAVLAERERREAA